jgi:hypothetical protein
MPEAGRAIERIRCSLFAPETVSLAAALFLSGPNSSQPQTLACRRGQLCQRFAQEAFVAALSPPAPRQLPDRRNQLLIAFQPKRAILHRAVHDLQTEAGGYGGVFVVVEGAAPGDFTH